MVKAARGAVMRWDGVATERSSGRTFGGAMGLVEREGGRGGGRVERGPAYAVGEDVF